jgi:hypothetical protein
VTDSRIPPISQALAATAGGFLRSPVTHGTCGRCFTPLAAGDLYAACRNRQASGGGPDLLGFMAYARLCDLQVRNAEPATAAGQGYAALLAGIRESYNDGTRSR